MNNAMVLSLTVLLSLVAAAVASDHNNSFIIGGLFDEFNDIQRAAFSYAIRVLNKEAGARAHFHGMLKNVEAGLSASKQVCNLLQSSALAVFGPSDELYAEYAQAMCSAKEVPHLSTGWRFGDVARAFTFNLYPNPRTVGAALASMIKQSEWKSFVLLYSGEDIIQLQQLLQLSSEPKGQRVVVMELRQRKSFKPLLKHIKQNLFEFRIVVQADLATSKNFLDDAIEMGMFNEYYHYVFANLDFFTLDLEMYKEMYGNCNVTTIRLVDVKSSKVQELRNGLYDVFSNRPIAPVVGIQTAAAIVYDGVEMLANIVESIADVLEPTPLYCNTTEVWSHGVALRDRIQDVAHTGITGTLSFDGSGNRRNYEYIFDELARSGFQEFARWNESAGFTLAKLAKDSREESSKNLESRMLVVTAYLEEPFFMRRHDDSGTLVGNSRFEGYCVDLLEEITRLTGLNFTIRPVKDNAYGARDEKGNWNGMVGELVRGEADLAVSAFTINLARSEAIDFSVPFMSLGISILFKRPAKPIPSMFGFLSPFAFDVWIYMLAAYIAVSLVLCVVARFTPYEWEAEHACDPDPEFVENKFTLENSFWFIIGSLMMQCPGDVAPKATSTRLVAGLWWFFTLILVSSYTANLAAFLTLGRMASPITSADDLAKQTKIKYGTLGKGSTMTFFKESSIHTYERMWNFMQSTQPNVFVNSTKEAIARVQKGDYAFLMESSMLEYQTERDCELLQIGSQLDQKGYGIGLRKHSPYTERISSAILQLQESTNLTSIKLKWWKQERGGGKCDQKEDQHNDGEPGELGLSNVGGVFVILILGIVIAYSVGVVEFIFKAKKRDRTATPKSMCSEMWTELQFAFRGDDEKTLHDDE